MSADVGVLSTNPPTSHDAHLHNLGHDPSDEELLGWKNKSASLSFPLFGGFLSVRLWNVLRGLGFWGPSRPVQTSPAPPHLSGHEPDLDPCSCGFSWEGGGVLRGCRVGTASNCDARNLNSPVSPQTPADYLSTETPTEHLCIGTFKRHLLGFFSTITTSLYYHKRAGTMGSFIPRNHLYRSLPPRNLHPLTWRACVKAHTLKTALMNPSL